MIAINYVGNTRKLSKVVLEAEKNLSYSNFQKLLRKKDIKVNGNRVSSDVSVESGALIEVFAPDWIIEGEGKALALDVVFEDKNILVADKPAGVEVQSVSDKNNLERAVNDYLMPSGGRAKAMHRIDRNTKGLVIFAKNEESEKELLSAFKNHKIKKFYDAMVVGDMEGNGELVAYLKTDKEKAISFVVGSPKAGFEKIITKFKVTGEFGDRTLLEIELVTGKTHQIRAHMAHIGHPLVGDGKYGDNMTNRKFGEKKQMLLAKRLEFDFSPSSKLYYLNGKKIVSRQSLI
ncbi:MAG: RluA family pseudouridine synthase [Clostridia bacterium]|nr:RluA family pseudouridine synthase [Clostridia bacterium]